MNRWQRVLALASLCAMATSACSTLDLFVPTSSAMHDASPAALATPSDGALVVFLRPSYFGAAYSLRVVDEAGHFVADVRGHAHVAVTLRPGAHVFTSAGRELDVMLNPKNILFAELGEARVYFVLVDVDFQGPALRAVTASCDEWSQIREWIADTDGLEPNEDALGRPVLGGDALIAGALHRAEALAPSEVFARTLRIEDGAARAW